MRSSIATALALATATVPNVSAAQEITSAEQATRFPMNDDQKKLWQCAVQAVDEAVGDKAEESVTFAQNGTLTYANGYALGEEGENMPIVSSNVVYDPKRNVLGFGNGVSLGDKNSMKHIANTTFVVSFDAKMDVLDIQDVKSASDLMSESAGNLVDAEQVIVFDSYAKCVSNHRFGFTP